MATPESVVVQKIRTYLKNKGYLTLNMMQVNPSGVPDMLVISPLEEYVWLEIKAPGGRLSPIQSNMHSTLRTYNCEVYTVESLERVIEIFKDK